MSPNISPSRRERVRHLQTAPALEVREVRNGDFFAWHDLFGAYLEESGLDITDRHALQVWHWISADPRKLEALVATRDGALLGFAHFHETVNPRTASLEVFIDDVYVLSRRERDDLGDELFAAVHAEAIERGASHLRWTACASNALQQRFSSRYGRPAGSDVYELALSA